MEKLIIWIVLLVFFLPDEQDKHMEKERLRPFWWWGNVRQQRRNANGGIVMRCVQGNRKRKDSMYIQLWKISWMGNR